MADAVSCVYWHAYGALFWRAGAWYWESKALVATRRFPPSWRIEETPVCYIVRDRDGHQALAYVFTRRNLGGIAAAKSSRNTVRVAEFQSRFVGDPSPAQPWPRTRPCAPLTPSGANPCPDAPGVIASAIGALQMALSLERVPCLPK